MKITHVIATLTRGGAERVMVDLANQQVRQGHQVSAVVGSKADEGLLRHELDPRVALEYIEQREGRLRRYLASLSWFFRRLTHLAEQDVIHAHLTFPAVIATALYGWRGLKVDKQRPRIIETYHAVGVAIPAWHRRLHAWMASKRDGLILMAIDDFWQTFVARHPHLPARIIPNGLAPPRLRTRDEAAVAVYRDAAGLPADGRLVFGSIGRLVPARRPELYVPIFAKVSEAFARDVHFLMAGEGELRQSIEAQAATAGIADRLRLPGLAPDPSLPRALIDLYVTINVGPVTGLNGLEAAFAGVPVIAIQLLEHYVPNEDDWIWSSASLDAVAAEAVRLLGNAQARSVLGKRQRAYVEAHHTIAAMADAYEAFYREAGAWVGKKDGSPPET
jgi:glycosyltransferase involved in cell wall biosynthesis